MTGRRCWVLVAAVSLAACSAAQDGASETAPDAATTVTTGTVVPGTTSPTSPGVTTTVSEGGENPPSPGSDDAPLFAGLSAVVTLSTPASGGGIRPLLEWQPVGGADFYAAFVYAPSGRVYWAWSGRGTSVHVGGDPQIMEDRPGASIIDGMSWAVIAYDADSLPIAVSPQAPIGP